MRGKQRYRCYVCGRQFLSGKRVDLDELWSLYSSGKQTYVQLAERFGCSTKTIQRRLDKVPVAKRDEFSSLAVVIMDTTYFGRGFGVMVFKNRLDGVVLKTYYTHKRLRSAYLSLKKHLPYLFVFQDNKGLNMPNTTNMLDGQFSDLKNRLRNHNGLSKVRKIKFIDGFFRHK